MSDSHASEVLVDAAELDQLRRIDRAARAYLDAISAGTRADQKRFFDRLCNALFNSKGEDSE